AISRAEDRLWQIEQADIVAAAQVPDDPAQSPAMLSCSSGLARGAWRWVIRCGVAGLLSATAAAAIQAPAEPLAAQAWRLDQALAVEADGDHFPEVSTDAHATRLPDDWASSRPR